MSGTIVFSADADWTASSGVFNWVIAYLADTVDDQPTREELQLIDEQNFRWLNLADLSPVGRHQVISALNDDLVAYSQAKLPHTEQRDAVVESITELAALAKTIA